MDPAAQPASLDPRYKFLTTLGRGGMGVVYKVLDRIEGQVVALKTLHPQGGSNGLGGQTLEADATDLLRFDQEIRALSLLHHEGIVRLFDVGHWEGRTYFTMEFLRGLPLQAFFNRPIPDATEIRWILRIFLKALDALEHLHREGFIHRDLKPSNIMVLRRDQGPHQCVGVGAGVEVGVGIGAGAGTAADCGGAEVPVTAEELLADPDPPVKILDLGLVKSREAALPAGRHAPGTPLFMAPEQVDPAASPDPRSDLYSLGVALYGCITRRLPFETVAAALSGHPPVPPGQCNPACPPDLSGTILQLLDRAPWRRPASALDLKRRILRMSGESPSPGPASPDAAEIHPCTEPPPRLLAPSFVGREEALQGIRGLLGRLQDGKGSLVAVTGLRGAGKTWLIDQSGLKTQAVLEHGFSYFQGRHSPGGPLHQGLREVVLGMLLDLARETGPTALSERIGPWGGALLDALGIDSLPEVRDRWPKIEEATPADLGPGRILQAASALLRESARKPRLILIDDLHLADDLDVEILSRAARGLDALPILIIATWRPEAPDAPPALGRWIEEASTMADSGGFLAIHLGAFTDGEASWMARSMLSPPGEIDPPLVGEILDRTGGVPRSIEAAIGALWTGGRLHNDGGTWRIAATALTEAREVPAEADPLAGLDPLEREILEAASILGDHFEPEILPAVIGGSDRGRGGEDRLTARLRSLTAAGLLLQTPEGFAFARPGLREGIGSALDPEGRRGLHLRAAEALLALKGEASADHWDSIARHFEGGGLAPKALEFHLMAGRRAARLHANRRSIASLQAALCLCDAIPAAAGPAAPETAGGPACRIAILTELGRLHLRIGEYPAALKHLEGAMDAMEAPSAQLLDEAGRVHQRQGDIEAARRCFQRSLDLAQAQDDPLSIARALSRLGGASFEKGDLAAAAESFHAALGTASPRGDMEGMSTALYGMGLVEKRRGALEPAEEHFRRSLECFEALGRETEAAAALNNLGNIHRLLGRDPEAIDCLRRSIAIRERTGDRPGLAMTLNNLARLLGRRGELGAAGAAAGKALGIFREVGDQKGILIAQENVGVYLLLQGDFPAAGQALEKAAALAQKLGDRQASSDAIQCLGRIHAARAEAVEADLRFREALRSLSDEDDRDLRASILAALALTRLTLGDGEGADDAVREALWLLGGGKSPESRIEVLLASSELELSKGELPLAEKNVREALDLLGPGGSRYDQALAQRQLGRVLREMGPDQVDRSDKSLGAALRAFEEMGAPAEMAATLVEMGLVWEALGEPLEAKARYAEALGALVTVDAPRRRTAIEERIGGLERRLP